MAQGNWEVKTDFILARSRDEYDKKVNELCRDNWQPFASEPSDLEQMFVIRFKRKIRDGGDR
jgi:hypothetical protein